MSTPTPPSNPFELLEVSHTATDEELQAAYRKKALEHHPDIAKSGKVPTDSAQFVQIKQAYEDILAQRKTAAAAEISAGARKIYRTTPPGRELGLASRLFLSAGKAVGNMFVAAAVLVGAGSVAQYAYNSSEGRGDEILNVFKNKGVVEGLTELLSPRDAGEKPARPAAESMQK